MHKLSYKHIERIEKGEIDFEKKLVEIHYDF